MKKVKVEGAVWVGLLLAALAWGFWKEANADEVQIEIGPTFLSGELSDGTALFFNQTFKDKYRVSLGYVSEQRVLPTWEEQNGRPPVDVRENIIVGVDRLVNIHGCVYGAVGPYYANAKTRWNGSNFVVGLSVGCKWGDRWSLTVRHWSNAGSAVPNMGQDMLLLGFRF